MEIKYTHHFLQKIESIFKSNTYVLRYEKGHFNSGYCVLKDKKVIVVNKFFDTEAKVNCLVDILQEIEIDLSLLDDEKLEKLYHSLVVKNESN
ncbi:MAG TPA: hypothetical protein VLZ75_09350 [Chitinophagales bacterium]|nr:hypothetical protein [Chitinophagales bacterium]